MNIAELNSGDFVIFEATTEHGNAKGVKALVNSIDTDRKETDLSFTRYGVDYRQIVPFCKIIALVEQYHGRKYHIGIREENGHQITGSYIRFPEYTGRIPIELMFDHHWYRIFDFWGDSVGTTFEVGRNNDNRNDIIVMRRTKYDAWDSCVLHLDYIPSRMNVLKEYEKHAISFR